KALAIFKEQGKEFKPEERTAMVRIISFSLQHGATMPPMSVWCPLSLKEWKEDYLIETPQLCAIIDKSLQQEPALSQQDQEKFDRCLHLSNLYQAVSVSRDKEIPESQREAAFLAIEWSKDKTEIRNSLEGKVTKLLDHVYRSGGTALSLAVRS